MDTLSHLLIISDFPVVMKQTFLDWGTFIDYHLTEEECLQVGCPPIKTVKN